MQKNLLKISLPISIFFLLLAGIATNIEVYADSADTPVYLNLPTAASTESIDITVNEDGIAQTGDTSYMLPYIICAVAVMIVIAVIFISSRRREVRKE